MEYEETELLYFSPKSIKNVYVVGVDLKDKLIMISLDCKAVLNVSCTFIDDVFGDFTHYGTMEEIHNAVIPVSISVSFDDNTKDVTFVIEDIEVNVPDIELDQYTLKEESRVRTDEPYRYYENEDENEEHAYTTCPACGCGIDHKNDGGNGFCIKCAPDH